MSRLGIRDSGNCTALPAQLWDSTFLRACRGEATSHTPVWLMRQAGRYMPHYRAIRARSSFLSLCKDPALSAEVAVYARDYLGVDAAIVFSDILVVLEALGMPLEFTAGDGPKLTTPLREPSHIAALREARQAAADLDYVHRTVALTIAGLPAHIPCIGFCGGPFTLASYAIEGGSSRHFTLTKAFMYREPVAWAVLMERLVQTLAAHLTLQIGAGASCVQIFESWGGALNRADFTRYVAPALRSLIALLPSGIPVIAFAAGAGHLQELIAGCGPDVLGVDSTGDLDAAFASRSRHATLSAVQGNLDPCLLLASPERLLEGAAAVLAEAAGRSGHIFNLGHGVLKETDPEQARRLVAFVHDATRATRDGRRG